MLVIRLGLLSVYGFFVLSWNQPMFAIGSFLFMPVKAANFFPTSLAVSLFSISQFRMFGFNEVHHMMITVFHTRCCFSVP